MEECDEISHAASKAIQFGFDEIKLGQGLTNVERIKDEINDLLTVIGMLNLEFELGFKPCPIKTVNKLKKVNHYAEYSRSLGRID